MSYVNPSAILGVGVTFIVVPVITVGTRLLVRREKIGLGLDDWFCVAALILVIGECSIFITGYKTGTLGYHSDDQNIKQAFVDDSPRYALTEKLRTAFDLIQVPCLTFIKLSVLFFYRRVFRGPAFNVVTWFLITFSVAWGVAFFIEIATICHDHFQANFGSLKDLKVYCGDNFVGLVSLAVCDVFVDLCIIVTPMPFIWSLQMTVQKKLAVTFAFLVGALSITCGITRMVIVGITNGPAVLSKEEVGGIPTKDGIEAISVTRFWAMLEMGVGIVAICLPALRPLVHSRLVESIVRSAHSAISLRSLGSSNKSNRSRSRMPNKDNFSGLPGESLQSLAGVSRDARPETEVHAFSTDEVREQEKGIRVDREVRQTFNEV